jgi:hypothetical protein
MKKLATNFRGCGDQRGAFFEMAKRTDNVCLFHRKAHGETTYEVIIVQVVKKDRCITGRLINSTGDEYYPSASLWGKAGWTYSSNQLEEAETRFQAQVNRQKAKCACNRSGRSES